MKTLSALLSGARKRAALMHNSNLWLNFFD
jgi:hypothetical protein